MIQNVTFGWYSYYAIYLYCAIPLLATTSAVVTDDTPLNVTPLSVLI